MRRGVVAGLVALIGLPVVVFAVMTHRTGCGEGEVTTLEGAVVEIADLPEFFDRNGSDESAMSSFFSGLGGQGTVALVGQIGCSRGGGASDRAAALELAVMVRAGLSLGSEGWDRTQAQAFADGMFVSAKDHVGGVGFLFADSAGHPLGPELASAAAVKIDEIERVQGGGPLFRRAVFGFSRGYWLSDLEDQAEGADGVGPLVLDASGRVLETLGAWPDRALDFLMPQDRRTGEARVEYWFGQRNWSEHDGFAGPASLWGGAVSAPGGPTSGWGDPAVCERIADLSPRVVDALADNGSLTRENTSEAGSGALGRALGVQVNVIAETLESPGNDDLNSVFGWPGEMHLANFNTGGWTRAYATLAEVVSVSTYREGGRDELREAIHDYQQFVVQYAVDHPDQRTDLDYAVGRAAMVRIASLRGLVDGAQVAGQAEVYGSETVTATLIDVANELSDVGALGDASPAAIRRDVYRSGYFQTRGVVENTVEDLYAHGPPSHASGDHALASRAPRMPAA